MTIQDFIKKRKHLVWYVKDHTALGEAAIVEATLNYGDWNDVQTMIKILGIKKVAKIFTAKAKPSRLGRTNYRPEIAQYFTRYFKTYA